MNPVFAKLLSAFFISSLFLSLPSHAQCLYNNLINAIKTGDSASVNTYIKNGCSLNSPTATAVSTLELALLLNQQDIFTQLVKADKTLVKQHGSNALAAACNINTQNKPAIELLISEGVNINALSSHGYSCLYNAAVVPDAAFFDYLIGLGANPKASVIPDPTYKIERLISVEDFIKLRAAAFNDMNQKIQALPQATQAKQ